MKYTKDSENLQAFVDSSLKSINIEPLNKTSENELSHIYHHMRNANREFTTTKFYKNELIKGDITYIPEDIKSHVSRCTHRQAVLFRIGHRNIYLSIYSPYHLPNFIQYVNKVYMWFHIAHQYANVRCSNSVNINIYLTDHLKLLPRTGNMIERKNVNTAFTTSCQPSTDICIYREQEWFKVLIHESFHNLGLDFSEMKQTIANLEISKMFAVDIEVRLYEAYCETWATIIHSMFISFFSTRIKDRFDIMFNKLDRILDTETKFSLLQCVKVLHHNNMIYTDLYKRNKYQEDTNVMSYYIIKSLLLYNKNQFIDWCSVNNKVLLDFNKTDKGIQRFCNMIRSNYMDPVYISDLGLIESKFKNNISFNSTAFKTLRMTVFELEN